MTAGASLSEPYEIGMGGLKLKKSFIAAAVVKKGDAPFVGGGSNSLATGVFV